MAADASETSSPPADAASPTVDQEVLDETVRIASETKLPIELGSIEITEDGRVATAPAGRPLTFSFLYRDLTFAGEVGPEAGDRMRLVGEFGKLPYTAELPKGRHAIRQLVAASRRNKHTHFFITPTQDIRLAMEIVPAQPKTPVSIVAAVTALLLEALPAVELMLHTLSGGARSLPEDTGAVRSPPKHRRTADRPPKGKSQAA